MNRLLAALCLVLVSSFVWADDRNGAFEITPFAGGFGVLFGGDRFLAGGGPLVAAAIGFAPFPQVTLGAKIGCYAFASSRDYQVSPLYSVTAEFNVSESLGLGLELPVLPSATVRIDHHKFAISVLPMYFASGGGTALGLSYGYQLRL